MTNNTDHMWTAIESIEDDERTKRTPVAIFVALLVVIGTLGNAHILVVFSRKLKNHSTYHVLICCLAISDLVVCVTYLPFEIAMVMKPFSFDFDSTCRIVMLNSYIWGIWTVYLILLIAVERYRRVCNLVSEQISCSAARKMCGVALVFAIINAAPIAYVSGTHTFPLSNTTYGYECFISDRLKSSSIPLAYFVTLLIEVLVIGFAIMCMYIPIRATLVRSNTERKRLTCSRSPTCARRMSVESNRSLQPNTSVFTLSKGCVSNAGDSDSTKLQSAEPLDKHNTVKCTTTSHQDFLPDNSFKKKLHSTTSYNYTDTEESGDIIKARRPSKDLFILKKPILTINVARVTVGLFLITLIFLVTLVTYMILILIRIVAEDTISNMSPTAAYVFLFGFELGYLNHIVNGFIYFYNDRRFRKELKSLYSCRKF